MKQLSPHFTLEEMVRSDLAVRHGIDNAPSAQVILNLIQLAQELEPVRSMLGARIILLSGYRCLALNRLLHSPDTSAHVRGLAVDFVAPEYGDALKVARAIRDAGIPFDQLINEGRWVHYAIAEHKVDNRNQTLTAHFELGLPRYVEGLQKSISRLV